MIINYSILLTFDGISHVSAFDLEAMCAWHMKHILRMWFITELFFFVSEENSCTGGSPCDRHSHLCSGGMMWLRRVNLNSEKSEISVFSNSRNPFVCFSKLSIVAKHFSLFSLSFSGKRWAKHYWIWESFPRGWWGCQQTRCAPEFQDQTIWEAADC